MQIIIIFLDVGPLSIDTEYPGLFIIFKSLPQRFFRDAVQISVHVFLNVCYGTKMMSLKVLHDFWEHNEVTRDQVRIYSG